MKFINFKDWLILERKNSTLEFGCIMLYADVPNWKERISIVNEKDLYTKDNDFGYETSPHTTIIYGLHDDEIDRQELYEKIEDVIRPVNVAIKEISFFECDDYDVVKFDVPKTETLKRYRKIFMKLPNTQTYSSYEPHMTIAYVKKEKGKKYEQILKEPFKVKFNRAVYSPPDGNKKYFDLKI